MPVLYCSFAEPGKGFLGAIITEARDVIEASEKFHRLGINPGGEVLSYQVPPDHDIATKYPRDVLLSTEELEKLGPLKRIGDDPKLMDKLNDLECEGGKRKKQIRDN